MGDGQLLDPTQGGHLLSRAAGGFTLIEMMITIAVIALLLVAGVPTMRGVIENGRIRAAGESWKYALTLARNEAVRRNTVVEFVTGAAGWEVRLVANGAVLHQGADIEGVANLDVTFTPVGADRVTFDGFGRIVDPNPDGSEPIVEVDIASVNPPNLAVGNYHPLRLQVLAGGMTRLCDPAVATTDPRACL